MIFINLCFCLFHVGQAQLTRLSDTTEDDVVLDDAFEWPVARPVDRSETVEITLFKYSKYYKDRYKNDDLQFACTAH